MDTDIAVAESRDTDSTISTLQIEMEELYSKYQLIPRLKQAFTEGGYVDTMVEHDIEPAFGIDALVQMYLHIRTKPNILVGTLLKHFEDYANPAQACAEELEKMVHADLIAYNPPTGEVGMRKTISKDLQKKLELYQYPVPMVEPPQQVKHNRQTGYLTIRGSLILKNNHHDGDLCLDHINRMNAVPLGIDADVLAFVQNKWRNIDRPKDGEHISKYNKRRKAFEKFTQTSKDVLTELLVAAQGKVWLTHRYDKRGRTYSQGYHFNYQGNDWCKAMVTMGEPEKLNVR